MKLELNIRVEYEPHGTSEAELRGILECAAEHLIDRGLITGETPAEVKKCSHEVRRLRRDIVTWRLPESAAFTILETLQMDSLSSAFDKRLRGEIADALDSITLIP